MNGKGDTPRNCFSEEYRSNYDAIFRKKPLDAVKNNDKQGDQKHGKDTTDKERAERSGD